MNPLDEAASSYTSAFPHYEENRIVHMAYGQQMQAIVDARCDTVSGVVFDLDHTLMDHKDWIARKLETMWQVHCADLPARKSFLAAAFRLLEEGHRSDLVDACAAHVGLDDDLRATMITTYRQVLPDGCRLHDDVWPTLHGLRGRDYALVLLTDNPPASQRLKIDVAELQTGADAIVLTGEMNLRKPDRRTFDAVASALGKSSPQLAMVGDNLHRDSLGALDAGYAHAFHVHHKGAMFDFSTSRLRPDVPAGRLTNLEALQELLWYLPRVAQ